jgi:predicted permease
LIALVTLGAGIAVNTTLFTVFNAVFLRPWPVPDASSVFEVTITQDDLRPQWEEFSLGEFRHLRDHSRSVTGLMASKCAFERDPDCRVTLDDQKVASLFVSRNYFIVLRVGMDRGPGFGQSEDSAEAEAVISYRLWQERFGGDPSIIGKPIRLNDATLAVVGVTPQDFAGTSFARKDVWVPLSARPLVHPHALQPTRLQLAGRLQSDVAARQAASELEVLSRGYRSGLSLPENARRDALFRPGRVDVVGTSFNPNPGKTAGGYAIFGLLALGTLLVLVLACANVGNLLLARGAARGREMAVRLSLGAGRRRLFRQLITETLVLATSAALIGLIVAYIVPPVFVDWIYAQFGALGTRPFSVAPDLGVVAWTAGLVVLTCLTAGVAPALHAVRDSFSAAMNKDAGAGGSRLRLRHALLGIQVIVSVVLLAGAALLVRSVKHVADVDLGFQPDAGVMSFELPASYDPAQTATFARQLIEVLADREPRGSVALASRVPFERQRGQVRVRVPGENEERFDDGTEVSPGYFEVLRIPVVAGRLFTPADQRRDVVVVNQSLAAGVWPGQHPVGKTITINNTPFEVVGVVKDVATHDRILRNRPTTAVYTPLTPNSVSRGMVPRVLVASNGPASPSTVAAEVKAIDPRVTIVVNSLKDNIDRQVAPHRMGATIAGVLGFIAVTFASIGVFGVFAYLVQQRTREIGVRMALGARPSQIVGFILRSSSPALVIGLVLGFGAALGGSKLIESSLIGISPLDPFAYLAVAGILACAGVVAVVAPTTRATRVDPVAALRCD